MKKTTMYISGVLYNSTYIRKLIDAAVQHFGLAGAENNDVHMIQQPKEKRDSKSPYSESVTLKFTEKQGNIFHLVYSLNPLKEEIGFLFYADETVFRKNPSYKKKLREFIMKLVRKIPLTGLIVWLDSHNPSGDPTVAWLIIEKTKNIKSAKEIPIFIKKDITKNQTLLVFVEDPFTIKRKDLIKYNEAYNIEYQHAKKDEALHDVFVLPLDSDERKKATLTLHAVQDESKRWMSISFDGILVQVSYSKHWFTTLRDLDDALNKKGYRILCNGTSLGVWPSGMSVESGQAYWQGLDKSKFVLVSIFEVSDWNEYATREKQREWIGKDTPAL